MDKISAWISGQACNTVAAGGQYRERQCDVCVGSPVCVSDCNLNMHSTTTCVEHGNWQRRVEEALHM